MKKMLALLVVATVATSLTGCGCCRRLRDTICRGAYCGTAAPAPIVAPPPVVTAPVAPMALGADCGCNAAPIAYDAGCGYPSGVPTMVGFGGVPCDTCAGGSYTLPSSGGFSDGGVIYDDPGYLSSPTTLQPADPGPAPAN